MQKFFKRIGSQFLDIMFNLTVSLNIKDPWVAIDGTVHSSSHASLYYTCRIRTRNKRWRRNYTKNQVAIDTESQDNTITGNKITNNEDGIDLEGSSNNNITDNNITNNSWAGISLEESSNNTITGNKITNNTYGI